MKEEGPRLDQGPRGGSQRDSSPTAQVQLYKTQLLGTQGARCREGRGRAFRRQTSTRLMKLEAEAAPGPRRVVVYSHNESSRDQEVRRAQARAKHPLGPGLNPSSAL